jgi:hypothetical protein
MSSRFNTLRKISGLLLILTLTACPTKPTTLNPDGGGDPNNSLDRLNITAEPNEVVQNGIVKLKAVLKGTGNFDQTVTWTVTGSGKLSKPSGLDLEYQAPAVLLNDEEVMIEAIPKADPSLSQKVTIYLRSKTFVTMYSFEDMNFNGKRDAESLEKVVPGVTFTLKDASGATLATTVADARGIAVFRDLKPQEYRIYETVPEGYGTSTNSTSRRLPITVGAQALTLNFGLTVSEIRGQVYLDYDFNQERKVKLDKRLDIDRDADQNVNYEEPGVRAILELEGTDISGKAVKRKVETDSTGRFAFSRLPAGTYIITELQPEELGDWKDTINPTSVYANLEVNNLTGTTISHDGPSRKDKTSPITLGIGEQRGTLFFAESNTPVKGWVFIDQNRNGYPTDTKGVIEDTEGIAGVKLQLKGSAKNTVFPEYDANFSTEVLTNSKGDFIFEAVPTGYYSLTEFNPKGYGTGSVRYVEDNSLTLPETGNKIDEFYVNNDTTSLKPFYFADTLSSIQGNVFLDDNNDGMQSVFEPGLILNVPVSLTGIDENGQAVSRTTRIESFGKFWFLNLLAGTYELEITEQPPGYLEGKPSVGLINSIQNGTLVNTTISKIVLPIDADGTLYSFGYLKK